MTIESFIWPAIADAVTELLPILIGGVLLATIGGLMAFKVAIMRRHGARSYSRCRAIQSVRVAAMMRSIRVRETTISIPAQRENLPHAPISRRHVFATPRARSSRSQNRRWHRGTFLFIGFLAITSGLAKETVPSAILTVPQEGEVLAKLHPGISSRTLRISPNGQRIAYMAKVEGGAEAVFVNDQQSPNYAAIVNDSLSFSPDSKRVGWGALHDGKKVVVVDGEEFPAFNGSAEGMPVWSSDSKHFAYFAETEEGKLLAVVDGKVGSPWDSVIKESFAFSPEGSRFAFVAKDGEMGRVVVDGKAGSPVKNVAGFTFSPDGSHFAYIAISGQSMTVIVDGVQTIAARAFIKDTLRFDEAQQVQVVKLAGDKLILVVVDLGSIKTEAANP